DIILIHENRSSLFVFRGNYIISGTISCVHKNLYNEFYKDSLYGFLFSTRSFFPASFGSTISGVDIEISLSIPISDFCF
ncbi:hypothetical protein, partial [Limosilactobacillus reuteri]|uniref:hypothetical protein n=1 Tax=Limosilactobacillus reuteri TaxID=1598 RepID=UPI001E4D3111